MYIPKDQWVMTHRYFNKKGIETFSIKIPKKDLFRNPYYLKGKELEQTLKEFKGDY